MAYHVGASSARSTSPAADWFSVSKATVECCVDLLTFCYRGRQRLVNGVTFVATLTVVLVCLALYLSKVLPCTLCGAKIVVEAAEATVWADGYAGCGESAFHVCHGEMAESASV